MAGKEISSINAAAKKAGNRKYRTEGILAILTLITLVGAAVVGFNRSLTDISPHLQSLLPGADRYERTDFEKYTAFSNSSDSPLGYITVKKSNAFGGPLKVAVSVDTAGNVVKIKVVEHRETSSWFTRVMESPLIEVLQGKSYRDPFSIGDDIDAITGATYTTRAIVESVKTGSRAIAADDLKLPKPAEKPTRMQFGFPEIVLIVLLAVGAFGIKYVSPKNKKRVRWICLLTGMGVIGFLINHPLTLTDINKFIMGYWPDLHHQLYWYLLVFGVLLIFLTTNKNVYCYYVCPFGAAQECIGLIGKAKNFHSKQYAGFFKWLRRAIVWLAVFMALIFRNPGVSSYEVYSTLFSLSGSNREMMFLAVVLVFSLFVKRPWCRFLCPVPAFEDYVRFVKTRWKEFYRHLKKPALKDHQPEGVDI